MNRFTTSLLVVLLLSLLGFSSAPAMAAKDKLKVGDDVPGNVLGGVEWVKELGDNAGVIDGKSMVVEFWATWCGPCKVLSPILEELSDEVDGVEFVKLDVDQHPQIAGQNQVMGVPTVVILKDGEVKDRFVGVQPKEVIKEKITSLG